MIKYTARVTENLKQAIIRFFQGANTSSNQETKSNENSPNYPGKRNIRSFAWCSPWRSEYPDNHWIRWG